MRVEANTSQARRIGKSVLLSCKILFKPKDRTLVWRSAQGKGNRKTSRGTCIACLIRKDFMDGAVLDTLPEDMVNGFDAEGKGRARRGRRIACAQRRDIAPQRREFDGCRHFLILYVHDMFYYGIHRHRESSDACISYRSMRVERMIEDMVRSTPSNAPIWSSSRSSSWIEGASTTTIMSN